MNGYNSTSSGTNPDQQAPDSADRRDRRHSSENEPPAAARPREFGGRRKGLEPTRYGDWEKDGRCIDF